MSGEARGVDAILKRSETLNRFGVSIKIEHVVYGLDDVGLQQHETGKQYGKVLDEHISTVCHLRGRKIHRLDTLLSDVNMVNDFYVEPNTKGDDSMATITESEKKGIAENYIKALANRDAALMTSITTKDIVWSIAGTSLVSGEARGVDAILKSSET
jgi:ketosteroid isomerase-like protein